MKASVLIGSKIRKLRVEKGYSQEYMAQRLDIAPATYSKQERGETDMTVNQLEKIAEVLEVEVSELLDFGNTQIVHLKDSHQNTVVNREAHVNYESNLKVIEILEKDNAHFRNENSRLIDIIAHKKERKGDPSV